MKVVTVAEMAEIEKKGGLSIPEMMENAGRAVAQEIQQRMPVAGRKILVLVGPGNNGGDGLVAARYLQEAGAQITAYLWNRKAAGDKVLKAAESIGVTIVQDMSESSLPRLLVEAEILIDALLGTGASRPVEGRLKEILDTVNEWRRQPDRPYLVAVDLPTGLNADTGALDPAAVPADLTVTLAFPKVGLYLFPGAGVLGEMVVADIGIPHSVAQEVKVETPTKEEIRRLLPARPLDAHKGTFGKVLVVAGSPNYTGAPYLAASAAARVGAGLVTLGVASMLQPVLASRLHEATFLLLPHDLGALVPEATKLLLERTPQYQALLLGPGLGTEERTVEFVHLLLGAERGKKKKEIGFLPKGEEREGKVASALPPLVIDADGLNALAKASEWWKALPRRSILTPHPGEMSRLLGIEKIEEIEGRRMEVIQEAAQKWNQVVVLKGAHTLIASPEGNLTINPFANPGLASAGTGDVLAGAIAGFLAQGLDPYAAAVCGVYVHGLAGEIAKENFGDAGMVASDLLPLLPKSIKSIKAGD